MAEGSPSIEGLGPVEPAEHEARPEDRDEPIVPETESINYFGHEIKPQQYPGQSPLPLGFFASIGQGASTAWLDVQQRWASLADTSGTALTTDEVREMVGDRDIDTHLGLTRRELERRIAMHDRDRYVSQHDSSAIGELIGSLPPYMLDPVNVATLPVGSANMARAAAAKSLGQMFKQSAVAGAKVSAAGAPLEFGIQMNARGEVNVADAMIASAAPFALTPVLSATGRALRGLRNPQGTAHAADARGTGVASPDRVGDAMEQDPGARPPPVYQRTAHPAEARARLRDTFSTYEGGPTQWLRELAVGSPRAREYAERIGIDPDAETLQDFVTDQALKTAGRSKRSGTELRRLANAATRVAEGRGKAADQDLLRQANMTTPEGLLKPQYTRFKTDTQALARFFSRGPDAATADEVRAVVREAEQVRSQLSERMAQVRAASPEEAALLRPEADRLKQRYSELAGEAKERARGLRVIDREVNQDELIAALDATLTSSGRPPQFGTRPRTPGESEPNFDAPDPDLDDIRAAAREAGVSEEEMDRVADFMENVKTNMRQCRSN